MYPDSDPRSWNYVRKYSRPDLHIWRVVLAALLASALTAALFCLLHYAAALSTLPSLGLCALALLTAVGLALDKIVIWCVKCYQHFAPIRVRCMCRFEPSCSEYMIQSVRKYGALRGVKKGLNRIYRCANKDGGFDLP